MMSNLRSINLVVAGVFAPVYILMLPSVNPQPGKRALEKAATFDFGKYTIWCLGAR